MPVDNTFDWERKTFASQKVEITRVDRGEDGETSGYEFETGRRRRRSCTLLLLMIMSNVN